MSIDQDKFLTVSGSDLPVILGNNNYENIWNLARYKLKIVDRPYTSNRFTRNGQFMEPKVRDYMNSKYGFSFSPKKAKDSDRHLTGNCDGLDTNYNALIEIKTFMSELKVDYYRAQCEFYMELFDIPVCLLVGYHTNDDFFNGTTYVDKATGETRDSLYESCYNTQFNPERVVIHRFFRDKEYFNYIHKRIKVFQELLSILNEDKNMPREVFYDRYYLKMLEI